MAQSPPPRFTLLLGVTAGVNSIVISYRNETKGTFVTEVWHLNEDGKATRGEAFYDAS